MQIRSKLTFSTIIVVLTLLTLGASSFLLVHRLAEVSQAIVNTQKTVLNLNEMMGLTRNILNLTELHVKSEDGVTMGLVAESIQAQENQLVMLIAELDGLRDIPSQGVRFAEFIQTWTQFQTIRDRVVGLSDLFSSQAAGRLLSDSGRAVHADSLRHLEGLIQIYHTRAETLRQRSQTAQWTALSFIIGFTTVITALIILGGLVMTRSITNPLLRLTDYLKSHSLMEQDPGIFKADGEMRALIGSLKIQVQNRTRELKEINERLEQEIEVRQKAERMAKIREAQYRRIFNNTNAWMAYTNIEGDLIETNIAFVEGLGYSEGELAGMNLKDLIPARYQHRFDGFIAELQKNRKAEGSMRVVGKAGNEFILDYQSNIIADDHENASQTAIHFARDITSQKAAERAFRESELRFKELVNTLPLSYFITDRDLTMVFANGKTMETFHGGRVVGQSNGQFLNLLAPEDRAQAAADFDNRRLGITTAWCHYRVKRQDGSEFPCEVLTTPVRYGQPGDHLQHILVDITERLEKAELKKQKEVAEAANTALSNWLNFVAHEIRNPLAGMISYARFGERKSDSVPVERLKSYFGCILTAGERLEMLLNDLLDLSKMEIGRMTFEWQLADLMRITREIQMENNALLTEKRLELVIDGVKNDEKPLLIVCDRYRIGQVIRNLLSNAIKFTPPGGTIAIKLRKTDPTDSPLPAGNVGCAIQVSICDNGIGIPADQLDHVFEKFRQSRKTRVGEGTGLGLPICREIIEAHGGQIWVQSTEGNGATFSFLLPYQHAAADQPHLDLGYAS
jgi:PAS domain S-box-containing protein